MKKRKNHPPCKTNRLKDTIKEKNDNSKSDNGWGQMEDKQMEDKQEEKDIIEKFLLKHEQILKVISAIITIMLTLITYKLSVELKNQQKNMDFYNKKTSYYSYSFEYLIYGQEGYPEDADIKFITDEGDEISVKYPTIINFKTISGMPVKRKLLFTRRPMHIYDDAGNMQNILNIEEVAIFNSADGIDNTDIEKLRYSMSIKVMPARKLRDGNYFAYYFMVTYGVDGTVHLNCIWYQIYSENNAYYTVASVVDGLDLELKNISVYNKNTKVDMEEISEIFMMEVFPNSELLKQAIQNQVVK